ncbi:TPA: hypothetical protein NVL90_001394 [Klebsiella oxytoca]|nr:hypothetical protein [Klebsiella oxytoca]HCJ7378767.1 hypothetical protein [Klebsiella oxytoca]
MKLSGNIAHHIARRLANATELEKSVDHANVAPLQDERHGSVVPMVFMP